MCPPAPGFEIRNFGTSPFFIITTSGVLVVVLSRFQAPLPKGDHTPDTAIILGKEEEIQNHKNIPQVDSLLSVPTIE